MSEPITIFEQIAAGDSQSNVALKYADIIRKELATADWPRINRAIKARWKGDSALKRIKTAAWKHVMESGGAA